MRPIEAISAYLGSIERRLRWKALLWGVAVLAMAALASTVVLIFYLNAFAFSDGALRIARIILFLVLAVAAVFGLIDPLLKLNRRRAAAKAEGAVPEFNQRLFVVSDPAQQSNAFLELVADDALPVALEHTPAQVVKSNWMAAAVAAAAASLGMLIWLIGYGPGFLGHGAALLWAGTPRSGATQAYYQILLEPGNRTVRRHSDQLILARTLGFQASQVVLYARYKSVSKWEQALMRPQAGHEAHEFVFAGLPETVEYYAEANGVRSATYVLKTVDLPAIKKIAITYRYPSWTGLPPTTDEKSADIRAVTGTEAEVAVLADAPLGAGFLVLDDGQRIALRATRDGWLSARLTVKSDGMYHIGASDGEDLVRLSEDYFIEALQETPPQVKIIRPGTDARVNPIQEVRLVAEAEDDFGLQEFQLHYSVNGGPEKQISLLKNKGVKKTEGGALLALEDFKLVPGDLVAVYATARDALSTSKSDIVFIEAEPFEREFEQSQQMAGMGGAGGEMGGRISERQKAIIAATFNQQRERNPDRARAAENGKFLAETEAKLRDQSRSLARRMQSRLLSQTNQEFQSFSKEMEAAAAEMEGAVQKLRELQWSAALPYEQRALQHLLRAEATYRRIQVAFGRAGGGGGGAGRDLESLFDLELDTEKNQYETGRSQPSDPRSREVDEALQKLEQLARRQQELAKQRDARQTPQQRWQQEMLRREAEELQRKMEELARGSQSASQQASSQQGQSSQSGQAGATNQQRLEQLRNQRRQNQSGNLDPRIQRALEQLRQATEEMRRAAADSKGGGGEASAEARRAAERLNEAMNALNSLRRQEAGQQLDNLTQRAEQLAAQQREFARRLQQAYPQQGRGAPQLGQSRQQAEALAQEKARMADELARLQSDMQRAVRDLQHQQRAASSKLREALGQSQQDELLLRMKYAAEWIRQGYGGMLGPRENRVTEGLERLKDQIKEAQALAGSDGQQKGREQLEAALSRVEQLRQRLQEISARGQQAGQRRENGQPSQSGQQAQGGQNRGPQSGASATGASQNPSAQQGPQPGQQSNGPRGSQQDGEADARGDRGGYRNLDGIYRSPNRPGEQGPLNPGRPMPQVEQLWRESMRELSRLRQEMTDDPALQRDFAELFRELSRWDPARHPGNPKLLEAMRQEVLPGLEQLELQLRRKLDEQQGGAVRSSASERVPPGYRQAVAEYFRRLSQGR